MAGWKEDRFPDCFLLTDYSAFERDSDMFTSLLSGETVLYEDNKTKVTAVNGTELQKLEIPFFKSLVDFPADENYGRVFTADIRIESDVLGQLKTKMIYAIAENTAFAFEYLLKNGIKMSYVVHVRYGHMLGGGRSNGMFIKRILNDLAARYFISDMNYESTFDTEAFDVYKEELIKRTDAGLDGLFFIPSEKWSDSGDVHCYRVIPL